MTVNFQTGNLAAYKVMADGRLSDALYVDQHTAQTLSPPETGPKANGIQFSHNGRLM